MSPALVSAHLISTRDPVDSKGERRTEKKRTSADLRPFLLLSPQSPCTTRSRRSPLPSGSPGRSTERPSLPEPSMERRDSNRRQARRRVLGFSTILLSSYLLLHSSSIPSGYSRRTFQQAFICFTLSACPCSTPLSICRSFSLAPSPLKRPLPKLFFSPSLDL